MPGDTTGRTMKWRGSHATSIPTGKCISSWAAGRFQHAGYITVPQGPQPAPISGYMSQHLVYSFHWPQLRRPLKPAAVPQRFLSATHRRSTGRLSRHSAGLGCTPIAWTCDARPWRIALLETNQTCASRCGSMLAPALTTSPSHEYRNPANRPAARSGP